jgi:hypothetical protein
MKNNTSRKGLFTSLAAAFFTILLYITINLLTGSEGLQSWLRSYGVGAKKLAVGVIVIGAIVWLLTHPNNKYSELAEPTVENIEPDIKRLFDSLKERYQNRLQSKLDGRFEIALEVSEIFDSPNPNSITERFDSKTSEGKAIEIIQEVFEKKDRLLVVGNAGAGKTTLLLKLAVSLLDKIDLAKEEAFPVIFNLASWSPKYERFEDWLKVSLESGYSLSKDFAATLLRQERIICLLDGLDELARSDDETLAVETRGECFRSLNLYLNHGKKVVISCRRDEFMQMQKLKVHDAPVTAKVWLSDLTKDQIRNALSEAADRKDSRGIRRDRTSAKHLSLRLERNHVLLDVLRTPFYFTTALAVYDKEILDKQIPDNTDDLKKELLDKFVDTQLDEKNTPNPNKFAPEKTKEWLEWLGLELKLRQLIDFELSSLQPDRLRRAWKYELLYGLVTGLGILICFGWFYGLIYGLYVCFKLFDISYLESGKYSFIQTEDIRRVKVANLYSWRKLKRGLLYGVVFGLPAYLIFSLRGDSVGSLVAASVLGLFIGTREIVREVSYFVKVDSPYQRLKAGFIEKSLIAAFVCLLMNALSLSVNYNESILDNAPLLAYSLIGGAIIGFSSTPLFRHFILRLCLCLEGAMPLKYATFLDYAWKARILEKDGGQWRFRHQTLQAYFADMKGMRFKRIMEFQ